ncbi:MAG TPA: peptide-methionine (R)-S-oxide reductase MsrB [Steroidobacteraceae bacterium]|nr:peptide-methionine (R)-S-oxide reductase MsrB [Steroidobacteraceae bacterium]
MRKRCVGHCRTPRHPRPAPPKHFHQRDRYASTESSHGSEARSLRERVRLAPTIGGRARSRREVAYARRALCNPESRDRAPLLGTLLNNKQAGLYACRLCGLPLFRANAKFESGTGWPSFYEPFDKDHVADILDESHGMIRVEIRCQRCDAHLGHVFDDGPPPTRKRYCLNSVSMKFYPEGEQPQQVIAASTA